MKKILLFLLAFSALGAMAQGVDDALRLSNQNGLYGTARYVSLGGAFGALGGDFTSLSNNPAGLGVYRSSEFTLTPSIKHRLDDTKYIGSKYSDSRTRFMFDNIGLVASFKTLKEEEKGLVMVNLGLGYNRIKDFYSETTAVGGNNYSIMDYFAGMANGNDWFDMTKAEDWDPYRQSNAPWEAIMAWNSFLIDTTGLNENEYWGPLFVGDGVYQDQSISSEGGIGEYTFSAGANFSNKFYVGATIGLQNVYYRQTIYYAESAYEDNVTSANLFKSMNYNQNLLVEGNGVNFKLGLIYRPTTELRLGLAAHTPTFYNLDEKYSATMSSDFNVGTASTKTPINFYDYKIETPYKLIGSVAYTFGKVGLISADYEYVDYSTMRFGKGGDGYRFRNENQVIKDFFTNAHNVRVGAEVWIGQLALRGGYAYFGSPYNKDMELSSSATNAFSGGFGLRMDNFFLDWAYQRIMYGDKYVPFATANEIIERDVNQNRFMLTIGFKF
ncbi:MAG: hypothetical protein PHE03_00980 [Bacteroidales bacterium]|nr:hypothetical protein [Bacteroidales bacterium]MDD3890859.1 hypothetical protein [Bacteroidales bacterium]